MRARGQDAHSLVSASSGEESDSEASWALLDRELQTEGIPSEYIQQNQEQIQEILRDVLPQTGFRNLLNIIRKVNGPYCISQLTTAIPMWQQSSYSREQT